MTTPTWQEAITPVTQAEYVDINLAALEAAGSDLNGWSDDAPQRALVEGESRAEAAESEIIAGLAKTASVATVGDAGASWVDAAVSWFDITRLPATFAVWSLPFVSNSPPSTVDSSNASAIQVQATDGSIFICTQESAVNFPDFSVRRLLFTARLPGSYGNVTPGAITKIISGPSDLVLVSNSETSHNRVVVARSQETNAEVIARALGKWALLGPGWTRPAFDYLIPTFGNTATTSVTRWSIDDANPNGPGTVEIAVADATGPASADTVTLLNTQLNGLSVKPVGSGELLVVAAPAHTLTINVTITTDGSNVDAGAQCEAGILALGNAFPLGPATLEPELVSAVALGLPVLTATIATGSTSKVITPIDADTLAPSIPGFSSVVDVTALDLVAPEVLAQGEVLVLTVNVTVLP